MQAAIQGARLVGYSAGSIQMKRLELAEATYESIKHRYIAHLNSE